MELYHASKEIVQYPEGIQKIFLGDFIAPIILNRQ